MDTSTALRSPVHLFTMPYKLYSNHYINEPYIYVNKNTGTITTYFAKLKQVSFNNMHKFVVKRSPMNFWIAMHTGNVHQHVFNILNFGLENTNSPLHVQLTSEKIKET